MLNQWVNGGRLPGRSKSGPLGQRLRIADYAIDAQLTHTRGLRLPLVKPTGTLFRSGRYLGTPPVRLTSGLLNGGRKVWVALGGKAAYKWGFLKSVRPGKRAEFLRAAIRNLALPTQGALLNASSKGLYTPDQSLRQVKSLVALNCKALRGAKTMSALAKVYSPVFSKTSPKIKPPPIFNGVKLNKNFLNYPLAQDPRKRAKWGRNAAGDWTASLPSDNRIQLTLHAEVLPELVRCPSALDMNILFQVLAEAQHNHSSKVTFRSFADLARRVGLTARATNRARLRNSLLYLSEIQLAYSCCWYSITHGKKIDREFPSPLMKINLPDHQNRIEIRVDPEWLRLTSKGFYEAIPLPLSGEATTQKLELMQLSSVSSFTSRDGTEFSYNRGRRGLTRKLGLNHATRNRVLDNSIVRAQAWFEAHKGQFDTMDSPTAKNKIVFLLRSPKVPRKSGPSSKPKADPQANPSPPDLGVKPDPQANPYMKGKVTTTVRNESADAAPEDFVLGGLDTHPNRKVVPFHPSKSWNEFRPDQLAEIDDPENE